MPATTALPDAAYTALADGGFASSELTRGPWNHGHQHAGPPVALVCRAVEQVARGHGLTHIARLTANLLRPVPLDTLSVEVAQDYVGRNAGHFSARLLAQGWTDALRHLHPEQAPYTFWDYFRQHAQRDRGLRIDHLLLNPVLAAGLRRAGVDRWVRLQEKASDHAPAWVEVSLPRA